MANTWTAYCKSVAPALNKTMCGLYHTSASRFLTVRRVGLINTQTLGISGVIAIFSFDRLTASVSWTSPTTVTPYPHDSNNSALSGVVAGYDNANAITTSGSTHTFRRFMWVTDEASITDATQDEWECIVPYHVVWESGYGDTNCQGLILAQNEGARLIFQTNSTAGRIDLWMEFTDEAV